MMAAPFGYIQGQRTDDIPFFKASGEWAPLHPPTTGSALVHSGSNNGLSWASYATLLGNLTHNELSATHADSNAGAVARGALIYGNTTPKWDKLTVGAASTVLRSDGTDPSWGTIDNTYIANRTRTMPVVPAGTIGATAEWIILAGVPDFAQRNGRYGAIALDATTDESVQWLRTVMLPEDFVSFIDIVLIHTNLGAGAGNVRWRVGYSNATDAQTFPALTAATDQTIAAPAQDVLTYTAFTISPTASNGMLFNFSVARLGTHVADTLANDAGFVGLRLRYTADM